MKTRPLRLGFTAPDAGIGLRAACLVLAICASAPAQSLVDPERVSALQSAFDSAAGAPQLRCQISAVRPVLDFGLRFQTGYLIDLPMAQFEGAGHSLNSLIRVTPEGLKPVWLENTGTLPEVPATKLDAEIRGSFVVGEGSYEVEALVQDDLHRVCHGQWRIQAKRTGSERELAAATPAETVEELLALSPRNPVPPPVAGIGRLTLMVHAAPLSPRASKLQESDVATLAGSLSSLLEQLPAATVRLVVFNLDQRSVIFQQDRFTAKDLEKVVTALNQLQLASVDYGTLRKAGGPFDMLADLLQAELRSVQPAEALILLGPRFQLRDEVLPTALDKPQATNAALFYLQYQVMSGLLIFPGAAPGRGAVGGRGPIVHDPIGGPPGGPLGISDGIEKAFGRLKGKTIAIRTPHEFADAIRRIQAGIVPCGADAQWAPPGHGRPPGPSRPCLETGLQPPQRDEGVPRGPGGPPQDPTTPTEPKFITPMEAAATDTILRPEREVGSATVRPPAPPAAVPKLDHPDDPVPPDTDPVEVLMRLRDEVLAHGARIPNYTCVETIQRDRYEPTTGRSNQSCDTLLARRKQFNFPLRIRLETTDRLRLDVALTTDREIYSWAGAARFEEGEIDELVPTGAMGTGPFAAHILALFQSQDPKFVFEGDTTLARRTVLEYSFVVPREESHYRVKAGKEWVVTGYTGTLLIDPKTADLVKLTVRTDELPPASGDCETESALEYGTVQLGGDDYLLPKLTHQKFIGRDGSESENTITFASCREYHAESQLKFGGRVETTEASRGSTPSALDLPPGLPVTLEVTAAIDGTQAAAGDRIEGRLAKPIRDAHQKTLVPEGTKVQGRLTRVEMRHSTPPEFTIALRWESLEINGEWRPFSLLPDRRTGSTGMLPLSGLRQRGMVIELPRPGEGAYGVYHSRTGRWESGMRTEWLTSKP